MPLSIEQASSILPCSLHIRAGGRAPQPSILLLETMASILGDLHRGYVLARGRIAHEGSGPALARDPKVAELCLGGLRA